MARGRPDHSTDVIDSVPKESTPHDSNITPSSDRKSEEERVDVLNPTDPGELIRSGQMKTLQDPRERTTAVRGDATQRNRGPDSNALASARALGGRSFAALEERIANSKDAFLNAPDGADLQKLRREFQVVKIEYDTAIEKYHQQAMKATEVHYYEVEDNNKGKARLASTAGSIGVARFPEGKVVDTLNYDIAALRKQGVRLKPIAQETADDST